MSEYCELVPCSLNGSAPPVFSEITTVHCVGRAAAAPVSPPLVATVIAITRTLTPLRSIFVALPLVMSRMRLSPVRRCQAGPDRPARVDEVPRPAHHAATSPPGEGTAMVLQGKRALVTGGSRG